MNTRTPASWLLGGMLILAAACGGGDDDDNGDNGGNDSGDDDGGGNGGEDSGDNDGDTGRKGSGTLKLDGKEYRVDIRDCLIRESNAAQLTGWGGSIRDEEDATFAGTGTDTQVSVSLQVDGQGYLAITELEIDGRRISWEGEAASFSTNKTVDLEFDFECE